MEHKNLNYQSIVMQLNKFFNPVVISIILIYGLNLWLADRYTLFSTADAYGILLIFGLIFSFLAYMLTRRHTPIS